MSEETAHRGDRAAAGAAGWSIPAIHLTCTARVPGLDAAKFEELAQDAKANCPVSGVLAGATITLSATLA